MGQATDLLPLSSWIMALVIGIVAAPGAFLAKRLTRGLSLRAHDRVLDGVVVLGGAFLIVQGFANGSARAGNRRFISPTISCLAVRRYETCGGNRPSSRRAPAPPG